MARYEFEQPDERLEFTGERYTPDVGDQIQHEHFHRYLLALRFCAGQRVVDVACGEGYGAALLAQVADEVVGVDSSAEAIEHASKTYGSTKLVFRAADATSIPVEDGFADVVVSFETIEHLADQPAFVAEVARILRPDGMLVLSTPDRSACARGGRAEPVPRARARSRRADGAARTALCPRGRRRPAVGPRLVDRVLGLGRARRSSTAPAPAASRRPRSSRRPSYLIAVATNGVLPELGVEHALRPGLPARTSTPRTTRLSTTPGPRSPRATAASSGSNAMPPSDARRSSRRTRRSASSRRTSRSSSRTSRASRARSRRFATSSRRRPRRSRRRARPRSGRLAQPWHAARAAAAWRPSLRKARPRGRSPVARPQAPAGLLPAAPALSPDEAALRAGDPRRRRSSRTPPRGRLRPPACGEPSGSPTGRSCPC